MPDVRSELVMLKEKRALGPCLAPEREDAVVRQRTLCATVSCRSAPTCLARGCGGELVKESRSGVSRDRSNRAHATGGQEIPNAETKNACIEVTRGGREVSQLRAGYEVRVQGDRSILLYRV